MDRSPRAGRRSAAVCPSFAHAFVAATLALALALGGCGSGADVPEEVAASFDDRYPGESPVWRVQPYGYEAVYSENDMQFEAEFSETGEWLETEYEGSDELFPPAVLDRIDSDFPGYEVTKYEVEQTPLGNFYEVEVTNGGEEGEAYYDDDGNPAVNENEDA